MGVGAVVQGADDDRSRSGAVPASSAAAGPAARSGRPPAPTGRRARSRARRARSSRPRGLPQVRRWNVPTGGMVRVLPRDGATVVDGSAPAIADLAAFGALRTDRALHYAADLDEAALRAQAARGASFVISDSNRRRVFVAARLRGNTGWTVPAGEKLSEDAAQLDPFPRRGHRRADRRARRRRGGLGPRRLLARLRPVPRAPSVRGARRRPGDRVAGRPRAGHRSPPPRRGLHGAARRRPRRPDALQRRPGPRGPRGGQRARVRRARRMEPAARWTCAACAR